MSVNSKMTALADAIRAKTNYSGAMSIDEMTEQVNGISTGSSGVERLSGYLSFGSTTEATDVHIAYVYCDESGHGVTQDIVYDYGNVVGIENPIKGSLVILKDAYGAISWDGVEQVDSNGTVFRITGQDSESPSIDILGKISKTPETCNVRLLCSTSIDFFVEYVTYGEIYEPGTYYTTTKREYFSGYSDAGFNVTDVVKGTLFKVIGVEYCMVDTGDLRDKYNSSIEIDGDGNIASCYFVEVNGDGDLLIS